MRRSKWLVLVLAVVLGMVWLSGCGCGVKKQVTKPAPPVVVTPPPKPVPPACKDYTVVRCDTLWTIAAKVYGDGFLWPLIYNENKAALKNANRLTVGMVLRICVLGKYSDAEKADARAMARRWKHIKGPRGTNCPRGTYPDMR